MTNDMKIKQFNWRSPLCIMHYALCILMLSGLSMSCSDKDDDNNDSKVVVSNVDTSAVNVDIVLPASIQ